MPVEPADAATVIASSDRPAGVRGSAPLLAILGARRWWYIAGIAGIAAICLTRALFGGLPMMRYGIDEMVALDEGWRVLSGQRPHVDFYSALGPCTTYILAFGLALAHGQVQGLNYGSAILGCLAAMWSFLIARPRMAPPLTALIGVFSALMIVAPTALGDPYFYTSEAMFYNRYGYVLLGIILMESYLEPRQRSSSVAGGASTGAACALLLFLKASYFFVAAVLIVMLLLFRRGGKGRIAGILLGFGGIASVILGCLGFHLGAVMTDLQMAASARGERLVGLMHMGDYWDILRGTVPSSLGLLVFAVFAGFAAPEKKVGWLSRVPNWCGPLCGAVLVIGAGWASIVSNFQLYAMPLNALFAIVLSEGALRNFVARQGWRTASQRRLGALLALGALCLFAPVMTVNARALAFGLRLSYVPSNSPEVSLIHSAVTREFKIMGPSAEWSTGRAYVDQINEGIDLLNGWSPPGETVYSLAYVNPFNYAMQRKPARGGSAWLHPVYNFSDTHKPSPEWLMGGADVIMVPKCPWCHKTDYVMRNYSAYLFAHFHPIVESKSWLLYRRNQS